ncbi:PBSX family phage terminase large subunit [Dongia sp.]|uniref:PBSX family phage terminase large subunit n=1 Tax=Dongia sp. TaxID=1977262 RepID=UPI003753468C
MPYAITTATKKIAALKKRIKAIQGGTSAGKTVGTLEVLIDRCQSEDGPGDVTSVVSETFPHLKRGAMRDFLSIMEVQGYFEPSRWNRSDSTYTFETGAILEFFSADQPGKVRGPRRKRLYINECNNIPYETFDQLEVRTKGEIFLDWNPTNEFWFYDKVAQRDDVDHIILTYRDNEALDPAIVASIEQRRNRPEWWKVYGEGQLGEVEGRIFRGWKTDVDEIPHEARLERYGLDFGYSNDPTAIVAIYYYNGGYILDEIAFQKGLSNKQIADIFLNQPKALIIADSAEPKSIDELKSYGLNVLPATKGPGSVLQRIQMAQDQQISTTKRSTNVIKEYRNYLWETDKDGRIINEPEHAWSHSMDAFMYGLSSVAPIMRAREMQEHLPRRESKPKTNRAL